jgi:hypothetical protein
VAALAWSASGSADPGNHDQETDLAAIGNPGGGEWASVAPETGGTWSWGVYARWLWEDIDADPAATLAHGPAGDEPAAKAAVQAWVDARTAPRWPRWVRRALRRPGG